VGFIATGVFSIILAVLVYTLYREPTKEMNQNISKSVNGASWKKMREVLLDRNILLVSFSCLGLTTVEFSLIAYLVIYLKGAIGLSVAMAAGFLALTNAGGAVGKPFFGAVSDRVFGGSRKKPLLIVGILIAISSTLMQVVSSNTPYIVLAAIFTIFGFGAIGWAGLNLVLVSEFAEREMTGFAVGFSVTIALLGNIAGPPIFGFIVDSMSSYSLAWWFLTASSIASLLIILPVKEVSRKITD
jgi:sugar phosphate permease